MEDDILFQPRRSAPTPSPTSRRQRSLPPSLPSFSSSSLFHRTLHPRISNKHHDITRAKIKTALELKMREERLREASGRGDCDTVINLLSNNPHLDLNNPDEKGRTPLHFACAGGHYECVQLLIKRGSNVNAEADVAGNRPLHLAIISNKIECVIALLEAGAKIGKDDEFHRSPLAVARSRLNILMKNSLNNSESVDPEEMAEDSNYIPENREIFEQVLQIIKILRHYLTLEDRSLSNAQDSMDADISFVTKSLTSASNIESPISTIEALDDLTSQLSQMVISTSNGGNNDSHFSLPESAVLNKVQNVLDNIIKYKA
ncbi:15348_t:CDS:2 [Acaulospora morrowiae]|uniref:15348_t:CDS:1 n=1 Tax=Acaulospora morrowiae TaxID=94023 RepID=A0A9N8ZGE0_9GLOM|nr:15348_t:CDS:2 [Acaulospora morrowiae]